MNSLASVVLRTIVPAVVVLTLFSAAPSAQSTSIWLEAECASVGSLWNKQADANASNSSYVVIQPGANSTSSAPTDSAGYIDFSFSVSQSGTYRVFARVLTPTANDDSWWVRMDGGSWIMWNNIAATSWTWAQFPNTFNLSAGSHTLTFAYREDGAQLDKINITTSTTAPTGAGSTASNLCSTGASVWLEAECGSLGSLWNTPSDGAASEGRYLAIQSGANSTSSAPTNSAGFANFPFSVSQSGTYRVFARVLCPTGDDDSWWVRMDGGSWVNWNNIAATSWTWAQFPNTFNLSAGSHTLTFAYREDGAQLDKINITTSTTAPSGAGSTASNLCSTGASVWLEAECGSLGSLWNTPSDGAASEGRYLTIQSGSNSTSSAPTNSAGFANFPFSVSQSGTYRVFARVLCPTGDDDSWWVRMDGGSWVNWNNIAATSWTWAQFPNTFNLSAGSHTLTFAYREDGAQLDKINITTSTTAPTGAGSTASNLCSTGATLSVAPGVVNVAAAANSADTLDITSNTSWTVTDNQSWLTVSPTSGSNNGTVTVTAQENTSASARTATVSVSATGVPSQTVTVTQSGSPGGGACNIPPMPSFASLPTNSFLPDPFTFMNGARVTTKAEWTCRRAEIATLAQEFEYGYKQNTPYSATTGSFSGNTLTVTVTDNGRTISFNASITYPSSGSGPFPAMIGVGGSNLNNSALSSMGVAVINFPNDQIAQQNNQSSRGVGKFYDLYGSGHSAGALMAWAWGVSRLIDALEKTPAANIDPNRLGVTGCSRNGKGALTVGAFDERIKLTIPQESGSGGSGNWRVSDWMLSQGQSTQTLSEIVGENVWFRANFNQFSSAVTKLPFDHHSIIGLVAPRAILIIENDILWLGPQSSWTSANAARMIWQAHGVPDMMGYSLTTGHNHCSFPSSQQTEVNAYVQRFLIGGSAGNTNVMRNDPGVTFNQAMWVNWTPEILVQLRRLYQSSQLLKSAE